MIVKIIERTGTVNIQNRVVRVVRVYDTNLPSGILADAYTQKGGILVATGNGTYTELLPGSAGQYLTPDSGQAAGIKWVTPSVVAPRVGTVASSATPSINTDNVDAFSITALATNITSMTTNLSGLPVNFQKLIIRIKDNGSARTITWGGSFEARGVALPTTTVISKVLTVGFIYDTVTSKWGCVASAEEL